MKLKTTLFNLGLAAILVGCSGSSDTAKTEPTPAGGTAAGAKFTKKEMRIVLIAKSSTNPVFLAAQVGADAAAEKLSGETGVKITVDWQTPPEEDAKVQAQRIAQATSTGADAIIVSCSNSDQLTGAINDAVDKGVPVMTFDSDAPKSKRFAFYGTDDVEAGGQTMAEVCKLVGDKGTIAILSGNQNALNLQNRVKGAQDEAAKHPNIKTMVFNLAKETPEDGANEVKKDMQANPQITGWAMIGAWPLFTPSLLNDASMAKVKVAAIDALPAQLAYVDKGIAPVLLAQPVYEWGYKSVETCVNRIVKGQDVPAVQKMQLVRVTKENLGDWARQLKDWKFTGIDAKYLALPPAKK
jgi:ribose transport system substrate-binding protein